MDRQAVRVIAIKTLEETTRGQMGFVTDHVQCIVIEVPKCVASTGLLEHTLLRVGRTCLSKDQHQTA
jgi:hypothetical protein